MRFDHHHFGNNFQLSGKNFEAILFKLHMSNMGGHVSDLGQITQSSLQMGQGHAVTKAVKILLLPTIKWEHSFNHCKIWWIYPLSHTSDLIKIWRNSLGNVFLFADFFYFFFSNFIFLSQSNIQLAISYKRLVSDWCENRLSGCWASYVTLTFDLTHNLDLSF